MDNLPLGQRCLKEGYKYISVKELGNYFDCDDINRKENFDSKYMYEVNECFLHFEPIESYIFGNISDKYLGLIEKIKPLGVKNFYVVYPCFDFMKPLKDPIVVGVLRESEILKYYDAWVMVNIDKQDVKKELMR